MKQNIKAHLNPNNHQQNHPVNKNQEQTMNIIRTSGSAAHSQQQSNQDQKKNLLKQSLLISRQTQGGAVSQEVQNEQKKPTQAVAQANPTPPPERNLPTKEPLNPVKTTSASSASVLGRGQLEVTRKISDNVRIEEEKQKSTVNELKTRESLSKQQALANNAGPAQKIEKMQIEKQTSIKKESASSSASGSPKGGSLEQNPSDVNKDNASTSAIGSPNAVEVNRLSPKSSASLKENNQNSADIELEEKCNN